MRRLLLVACGLLLFGAVKPAHAGCYVVAQNGWVRIWMYQETPQGQKGRVLWTLDFPKGASKPISDADAGPNKRIRWDYTTDPNDHHGHGNVGASCINNSRLLIP